MSEWRSDELRKIGAAEELEFASLQGDGSLRRPVTIWVARLDDDLYVRPIHGRGSAWFRGAEALREGRVSAGGVDKDVSFVEVEAADDINDQIDAAYRAKYHRYAASIVSTVVSPQARAATMKLTPR